MGNMDNTKEIRSIKEKIINFKSGDLVQIISENESYNKIAICIFIKNTECDNEECYGLFKINDTDQFIKILLNDNLEKSLNQFNVKDLFKIEAEIIESADETYSFSNLEVISEDFDNDSKILGYEKMQRELTLHEKFFSYNELKDDLKSFLLNNISYNSTFDYVNKKSEILLDMALKRQILKSKKNIIENFLNNNYSDYLIKPITEDVKKMYVTSDILLNPGLYEGALIYNDIHFVDHNKEQLVCKEFYKLYENESLENSTIEYQQGLEKEITVNIDLDGEGEKEHTFKYINRPYFIKEDVNIENCYYKTKPIETPQLIYRSCSNYPSDQK